MAAVPGDEPFDQTGAGGEAAELIRLLGLAPHPEGGHYRETFRDPRVLSGSARACSTAIYFLLQRGEVSRWHRVDAAEVWHFYRGAPLLIGIGENQQPQRQFVLGTDFASGQQPQVVVPAGAWQQARSTGDFTLVGCTVAPAFEFAGFELARQGFEPN